MEDFFHDPKHYIESLNDFEEIGNPLILSDNDKYFQLKNKISQKFF